MTVYLERCVDVSWVGVARECPGRVGGALREIQTMWLFGVFSVSDVDCPFWTRHLPAERRQRWSL